MLIFITGAYLETSSAVHNWVLFFLGLNYDDGYAVKRKPKLVWYFDLNGQNLIPLSIRENINFKVVDILLSNEADTRTYLPYITSLIVKIYSQYGVCQNTTTWKRYKIINIQWLTNLVFALSPFPFCLPLQTESFKLGNFWGAMTSLPENFKHKTFIVSTSA